jgi:hypothetical protein
MRRRRSSSSLGTGSRCPTKAFPRYLRARHAEPTHVPHFFCRCSREPGPTGSFLISLSVTGGGPSGHPAAGGWGMNPRSAPFLLPIEGAASASKFHEAEGREDGRPGLEFVHVVVVIGPGLAPSRSRSAECTPGRPERGGGNCQRPRRLVGRPGGREDGARGAGAPLCSAGAGLPEGLVRCRKRIPHGDDPVVQREPRRRRPRGCCGRCLVGRSTHASASPTSEESVTAAPVDDDTTDTSRNHRQFMNGRDGGG